MFKKIELYLKEIYIAPSINSFNIFHLSEKIEDFEKKLESQKEEILNELKIFLDSEKKKNNNYMFKSIIIILNQIQLLNISIIFYFFLIK